MIYILSKLTGKYYLLENNIHTEIPIDDSKDEYNLMIQNADISEVESLPFEELAEKQKKAIAIDLEYTKKIDDLMTKHHNKVIQSIYFGTTYIIPQIALDEMQALKDECNARIAELGITDYSYRQSVPQLAKTINK